MTITINLATTALSVAFVGATFLGYATALLLAGMHVAAVHTGVPAAILVATAGWLSVVSYVVEGGDA